MKKANSSGKSSFQSDLESLLTENIVSIISKCHQVQAGHIGGSLSLSLFLLPLLYSLKMSNSLNDVELVLSKGHASLGLYSILHTLKINSDPYHRYCTLESDSFHGHTCKHADNLIVHSTGSLGHGLPFAYGRALGNRVLGVSADKTILCIIGDGEMQEGTFYECYLHLSQHSQLNLKVIIDDNNSIETQTSSCTEIIKRISRDNFSTIDCSGFRQCISIIDIFKLPGLQFIHCKTSKYVGLPSAFHDPKWHAGIPTDNELHQMITGLLPIFTK